jgi:hypothetical protein
MNKKYRHIFLFFLFFSGLSCLFLFSANPIPDSKTRLEEKAEEALLFCKEKNMNEEFAVLIDMRIHSGRHRMFIWNFKENKTEHKALCAHGAGRDDKSSTGAQPLFSNENGSWLTSLGKYKLGIRSYSQWGINIHYKMYGLEKTNNNAYERIIVLHSHNPVPEEEIYPQHLPMGWSLGCPVTDNATMKYIDRKLKASQKPVLLWIYY